MGRITKSIKQYWFLWLTIIVGIFLLGWAINAGSFALQTSAINDIVASRFNRESISISAIIILCAVIISLKLAHMLRDLAKGNFGVDILAVIAIIACLLVGEFWAAYVIVLMLCSGEALEKLAEGRARRELTALIKRRPQTTHLLINNKIEDISINQIKIDQTIIVKPAEVVPVDGVLLSSHASLDESSITGESIPVNKTKGDKVISGALNTNSPIQIRATSTTANSYYSQLVKLVQESANQPSHFVNLANRYAIPFTLVSLIIASLAWIISGNPVRFAEVLVVASPCPLILAAPIAFVSGMSRSSRHGIIVKNGNVLEKVARADTFAFDKTGTLTSGKVTVDSIETTPGHKEVDIIAMIAAAESVSNHVLAESAISFAKSHNITPAPATGLREIPGKGIFASVGRKRLVVGNLAFLENNKITNLPADTDKTAIYLAINGQYAGAIYFVDRPRRDAKSAIVALRQLGVKNIAMLSGDKQSIATVIARHLGINLALGGLSPTNKIDAIAKLQKQSDRPVVMVGDGINDAPVLAKANVGIAMGARGSTAASESADAVITIDQISKVATLRQIAARTLSVARQSVIVGIVLCLILELIALTGVIPAIIGALLQEAIDATVIIAALRAHKG